MALKITFVICMTSIAVFIVCAMAKCREPRLKRTECFTDKNGNVERWISEYE